MGTNQNQARDELGFSRKGTPKLKTINPEMKWIYGGIPYLQNPMKISTKGPDTPHPNRLGWRPCWACHLHRWVHCCSAAHARRSSSYAARKPPIWGLSKTEGIKEICQFKTKMMKRQICWCLWNKPITTPEKLRWNPKIAMSNRKSSSKLRKKRGPMLQ